MLIAVDPGMNSPGVAMFRNSQEPLLAAGRVSIPERFAQCDPGQRWHYVAEEIVNWVGARAPAHFDKVVVVFENPQFYTREKSKGDPNKLVGVTGVAANVCGLFRPDKIISPNPADWIGQLSKECPVCRNKAKKKCLECHGSAWETPRGRYIHKRLTETELALVPDQNDAIDAVGIGLWALGRLTPQRAYSNGRDGR